MSEKVAVFTEMGGELIVRWDTETKCGQSYGGEEIGDEQMELKAAFDGLQSMILGHALAGVEVDSDAYHEGLMTAVEACLNHFD